MAKLGVGSDGDKKLVADAATVKNDAAGGLGEELAAKMGDHKGDCRELA